jgi:hypothetical protein
MINKYLLTLDDGAELIRPLAEKNGETIYSYTSSRLETLKEIQKDLENAIIDIPIEICSEANVQEAKSVINRLIYAFKSLKDYSKGK